MADELKYDILVREQMTEAAARMTKAMETMASKVTRLEGDLRKLASESRAAENATRGLGEHTERTAARLDGLRSKVSGLAATAAGFAAGGLAAAGAGLAGLATLGIKTAADNETARVSFDLLLGSAQKAGDFLQKLTAFATHTPFDMPTLRDASSRLLAVGVNAKDVIPIMTRLGDATAGMDTGADGINRAVYALQQMRQAGKVSLDDINQLTNAGIPALDALATHYKKSVADVREMISKGQVKADDLFGAIEKGEGPAFARLSGMMDKQSATLLGKWSNFKDTLSEKMAGLFQAAIPSLGGLLDRVSTTIPKLIGYFSGLRERIKGIFAGDGATGDRFMAALETMGSKLLPELRKAFDGVVSVVAKNHDGLIRLANFISNNVIPVVGVILVGSIRTMAFAFEATVTVLGHVMAVFDFFRHGVVNTIRVMVDSVLGQLGIMVNGAANAFGWIPGLGPKLRAAADAFNSFVAGVNAKLDQLNGAHATIHVDAEVAPLAAGTSAHLYGGRKLMADGGRAAAGTVATVGENGRETVVFGSDATVIPNGAAGATPAGNININVVVNAAPGVNGGQVGATAGAKIVEAIRAYERRNGTRWRTVAA